MPHSEIPVFDNSIGFETVSVTDTVKTLTASEYSKVDGYKDARAAIITVDGDPTTDGIRWTTDGTSPTSGPIGHFLPSLEMLIIRGFGNIKNFKAVREGANTVNIHVTYFR